MNSSGGSADEPTQTTPTGDERNDLLGLDDDQGGLEISVPKRDAVLKDLRKVATPNDD